MTSPVSGPAGPGSDLGTGGLRAAAAELTGSLAQLSPQGPFASRLIGPDRA